MSIETELLIDHTIAGIWDALPQESRTSLDVENELLQNVIGRLEAFKLNPQAFRPQTPIDKDAIKRRFAKAYASWSDEETSRLADRYRGGASIVTLTAEFERSRGAITRRLERLGLIDRR